MQLERPSLNPEVLATAVTAPGPEAIDRHHDIENLQAGLHEQAHVIENFQIESGAQGGQEPGAALLQNDEQQVAQREAHRKRLLPGHGLALRPHLGAVTG